MSLYAANNAWSYTMDEKTLYVHFLIQHCVHVFITIKIHNFIFFINGNINIQSVLWSQSVVRRSAQLFKIVFNLWLKKVPNYSPIGDGWINDFWRRPFHSRCGRIIFWQKCFMATVSGLTDELVLTIIVIVVVIGGAWCCCDLDRHSKNGRFFSLEDDIFEKGQWRWSLLTFQRTIDYALIGEHFFEMKLTRYLPDGRTSTCCTWRRRGWWRNGFSRIWLIEATSP